jgi:hypothetical protein
MPLLPWPAIIHYGSHSGCSRPAETTIVKVVQDRKTPSASSNSPFARGTLCYPLYRMGATYNWTGANLLFFHIGKIQPYQFEPRLLWNYSVTITQGSFQPGRLCFCGNNSLHPLYTRAAISQFVWGHNKPFHTVLSGAS